MATNCEPEYASVDAFAEYLLDDDRTTFTLADCQALGSRIKLSSSKIIHALEAYGFKYLPPTHERSVRGFNTSSHDRWTGPGSSSTHGGSGSTVISGFAGKAAATY